VPHVDLSHPLGYVVLAALGLWYLPVFGQRCLAFLRDLDEYRATRRLRRVVRVRVRGVNGRSRRPSRIPPSLPPGDADDEE
jgi:hypothetical protein